MLIGCSKTYTPRPTGYLRFRFPEKIYEKYTLPNGISFKKPVYMNVILKNSPASEKWFDLSYPDYKTVIHVSYKPVNNNLPSLVDDAHKFVYQHTVKASGIDEIPIDVAENKTYGIMYRLYGNVATNLQFMLTDSTEHFLRGSMYIMSKPNEDSLSPIIDFAKYDVEYMLKTLNWK